MTEQEKLLQLSKEMYMFISNLSDSFGQRLMDLEDSIKSSVVKNDVADAVKLIQTYDEPVKYNKTSSTKQFDNEDLPF